MWNLQLLFRNCTHLNGSHIDQMFVAKSFLQRNVVNNVVISIFFFLDNDAGCFNF